MRKQQKQQSDSRKQQQAGGKQQGQQKNDSPQSQQGHKGASESGQHRQENVHGEGNYAASRQYNDATRAFAKSGKVEAAARDAEPRSDADALQMAAAEAEGKRHSKGEDPALGRKSSIRPPEALRAPKPGEEE